MSEIKKIPARSEIAVEDTWALAREILGDYLEE